MNQDPHEDLGSQPLTPRERRIAAGAIIFALAALALFLFGTGILSLAHGQAVIDHGCRKGYVRQTDGHCIATWIMQDWCQYRTRIQDGPEFTTPIPGCIADGYIGDDTNDPDWDHEVHVATHIAVTVTPPASTLPGGQCLTTNGTGTLIAAACDAQCMLYESEPACRSRRDYPEHLVASQQLLGEWRIAWTPPQVTNGWKWLVAQNNKPLGPWVMIDERSYTPHWTTGEPVPPVADGRWIVLPETQGIIAAGGAGPWFPIYFWGLTCETDSAETVVRNCVLAPGVTLENVMTNMLATFHTKDQVAQFYQAKSDKLYNVCHSWLEDEVRFLQREREVLQPTPPAPAPRKGSAKK